MNYKKIFSSINLFKLVKNDLLFALLFLGSYMPLIAQASNVIVDEENYIYVFHINANTSDASLNKAEVLLKKSGVTLNFKKIKRNKLSEITKIKVVVYDSYGHKSQYVVSGLKPINSYNFRVEIHKDQIVDATLNTKLSTPPIPPVNSHVSSASVSYSYVNPTAVSDTDKNKSVQKIISDTTYISKVIVDGIDFENLNMENFDKKRVTITIDGADLKDEENTRAIVTAIKKIIDLDTIEKIKESKIKNVYSKNLPDLLETKTKNQIIYSSANEKPLIVIDGEEKSYDDLSVISPDSILSVNVLKTNAAQEKYGDKGTNGVIIIKTIKSKKE